MRKISTKERKAAEFARRSQALQDSIHRSVAAFVAHHGGKVLVSGPIQIMHWPGDKDFHFDMVVKCTGRKPLVTKFVDKEPT